MHVYQYNRPLVIFIVSVTILGLVLGNTMFELDKFLLEKIEMDTKKLTSINT